MSLFSTIWDAIWWLFSFFILAAYLMALFSIIADLFRDRALAGWAKAIWFIFLIFVPFLTALVYLITRGSGMAQRSVAAEKAAEKAASTYIKTVAGTSPASEIAQAKELLDSGAISQDEFDQLKAKVLSEPSQG